jgi:hypothetical protein
MPEEKPGFAKPGEKKGPATPAQPEAQTIPDVTPSYFESVLANRVILPVGMIPVTTIGGSNKVVISFHDPGKRFLGAYYLDPEDLEKLEADIAWAKKQLAEQKKATK